MRERQRAKDEEARLKEEEELMARLTQLNAEKAARLKEQLDEAQRKRAEPAPEHKMLRVDQVAAQLGISTMTVRRWFGDRALKIKPGLRRTTMLIPQQALDDWCAEHAPKPNSR